MRKISRGKVYDTETAKLMGGTDDKQLYKKRGGWFFFYPKSDKITPITEVKAMAFAEEAGIELQPEGDRERVNVTINAELMSKLRQLSETTGISQGRLIDKAIANTYTKEFEGMKKQP